MTTNDTRGRRPQVEDTDSDEEDGYQTAPQSASAPQPHGCRNAHEEAIRAQQNAIQMADLGTETAGFIKSVDKGPAPKINMVALLANREVNQVGSEAHAAYLKNKKETNAWNSMYYAHIREILLTIL